MADECGQVLALKSYNSIKYDYAKKLAFLKIVDQASYSQDSLGITALIPTDYGVVEAGWDSFNEARNSYLQRVEYKLDEQESLAVLQVRPADGAIQAWLECMKAGTKLNSWVDEQTDAFVRLVVRWDGGPGLRNLQKCKVKITEGKLREDDFTGRKDFDNESYAYVAFSEAGRVSGVFQGESNGTPFMSSFKAARPIKPAVVADVMKHNIMGGVETPLLEFTAPFEQTVHLQAFATAHYEHSGDPSATFSVFVDGQVQGVWSKIQMHLPYPKEWKFGEEDVYGQLVANWTGSRFLNAGQKVTLKATAESFRAKSDNLFAAIHFQRYGK